MEETKFKGIRSDCLDLTEKILCLIEEREKEKDVKYDRIVREIKKIQIVVILMGCDVKLKKIYAQLQEVYYGLNKVPLFDPKNSLGMIFKTAESFFPRGKIVFGVEAADEIVSATKPLIKECRGLEKKMEKYKKVFCEIDGKVEDACKAGQLKVEEAIDNYHLYIDEKEKELENKKKDIFELCHVIGSTSQVYKYSNSANKESTLGFWWRIGAIASCVSLILFVLISVWGFEDRFNLLENGFSHYWVFVMFLIPFVYCAKESGTHYNNARRYRRKELDLAAISPYLSDLPDEDGRELKKKLAESFFCNEDRLDKKDGDERSISLGFGSVKELLDYSLKIFKAGK